MAVGMGNQVVEWPGHARTGHRFVAALSVENRFQNL
jgi:hypothetical protein